MATQTASDAVLEGLDGILGDLGDLYKDVHSHPELSMQEQRTAAVASERLGAAGFEVTDHVGKTGWSGCFATVTGRR